VVQPNVDWDNWNRYLVGRYPEARLNGAGEVPPAEEVLQPRNQNPDVEIGNPPAEQQQPPNLDNQSNRSSYRNVQADVRLRSRRNSEQIGMARNVQLGNLPAQFPGNLPPVVEVLNEEGAVRDEEGPQSQIDAGSQHS
jgi:hypothetical protein